MRRWNFDSIVCAMHLVFCKWQRPSVATLQRFNVSKVHSFQSVKVSFTTYSTLRMFKIFKVLKCSKCSKFQFSFTTFSTFHNVQIVQSFKVPFTGFSTFRMFKVFKASNFPSLGFQRFKSPKCSFTVSKFRGVAFSKFRIF